MNITSCTLCALELPSFPISDGDNCFCCAGCHAVFQILTTKGQLDNFQSNPIFQQAVRSGLISNPALLEQIRRNRPDVPEHEMEKLHLEVSEMWCPACAEVIRLVLLQEKGVRNCVVDYATDLASVEFTPRYLDRDKIYQLINALGYKASPLDSGRHAVSASLYMRLAIAAFFSLNIMMFAYPLYASYFEFDEGGYGALFAWLSFYASLPVITYSAWPIFRRFFTSLQVGLFGMETLVVLGVGAAFGLSVYNLYHGDTHVYFDSLTVIITFVLLGKMIEAKAKFSAKESLLRLARALPRRGRKKMVDGTIAFVPIKELIPGDLVLAFSGEKIVLDGVVVDGSGGCDESIVTGESIPVMKRAGSKVISGSILQNGSLVFRVTNSAADSTLSKIISLVQQEIGHKTSYVRSADRIVRWFVPTVLTLALLAALYCFGFGVTDPGKSVIETALTRGISILLISCPCAIGIAAPLAESHVMNGLANLGAIVRNRGSLSLLGFETVFVFDKTGTVTEGCFNVLAGFEKLSEGQKSVLKAITAQSIHPISCAIHQSLESIAFPLNHVEEIAGKGIRAKCDDQLYYLGSADFMLQNGITLSKVVQEPQGINTTVYFAHSTVCLTALVLGDRLREDAKEAIRALAPAKTLLLSGDGRSTVEAVAKECGFAEWRGECSPLQKREIIEELRKDGQLVCMLGDGINDAPALTAAQIAISVVSASDISIQVSDVLLTTDRLMVVAKIGALAKKGQRIIKQNLFWAFFYNVIGIVLAIFGLLSPIFAAFAMVMSSLMVLFNAKRLGGFAP